MEKRTKDWAKDGEILGYCFVDDVDKRERYDSALFYVRPQEQSHLYVLTSLAMCSATPFYVCTYVHK